MGCRSEDFFNINKTKNKKKKNKKKINKKKKNSEVYNTLVKDKSLKCAKKERAVNISNKHYQNKNDRSHSVLAVVLNT